MPGAVRSHPKYHPTECLRRCKGIKHPEHEAAGVEELVGDVAARLATVIEYDAAANVIGLNP